MKKRFFIISLFWVLAIAAFGAIVMLLWNFVVPGVLGLATINFWQALALFVLARIFFGGLEELSPPEEECPVVKRVTRSALNGRRCLRKNARISLIKERSSDSVALSEETDSSTRETLIETTVAKLPKRMNNLTGKGNSLEELIVEHQPRLKAFIRKRVSSKEDAEDILQDVLYQLVKTIESTFNPIEQVTAWLYRVARNTIINKGKKMQEEELPDSSYDKEDNVLSEFSEVLFSDAPPTPEVAEKENDGQEVKPVSEGVRNVPPQHTGESPQIRSPANERSPSGNFIADRVIIGRPGFGFKDESRPKGIKI